jgi:hypothetical protein
MDEYEKFFQQITAAVLGRKLTGLDDYSQWLMRDVQSMEKTTSVLSGKPVLLPPFDFFRKMKGRAVVMAEAYGTLGLRHLEENEVERLSLSNAQEMLGRISITTADTELGVNQNLTECSLYYNTFNCYRSSLLFQCKNCAYCFWPRMSVYSLGCQYLFDSQFCIKCYNSAVLNRCLEMSDCNNCTDSMFCYNCEGLSECMFCFNVKNLRYAVGNVPVAPAEYKALKARFLKEIGDELERTKALGFSIYNFGTERSSKPK